MKETQGAKARVVVLGGANIDIQGKSGARFLVGDSNPGMIRRAFGGVGRNIAENCARLGLPTWLITAFGDDSDGGALADDCEKAGIDTGGSLRARASSARYLCALGPEGELVAAVADMAVMDLLTPEFLETRAPYFDAADYIVADANLPAASLAWLAGRYGRTARARRAGGASAAVHNEGPLLFLDPVSATKARRAIGLAAEFDCMKPNRAEAAAIAGLALPGGRGKSASAEPVLEPGELLDALAASGGAPAELFISLGEEGIYYYKDISERGRVELPPPGRRPAALNRSGAGDAACAALVWATARGMSMRDKARCALAAAALAAASPEPVSEAFNEKALIAGLRAMYGNSGY